MPRLVPLAVALLAVLAGCTGGPIAPDGTETPNTQTPTDAPPTTDAPTATPDELTGTLAPGVTADGVENASALLDAHVDALRANGFVLELDRSVERDGESYAVEQRWEATTHLDVLRGESTTELTGETAAQRHWLDDSSIRMLTRTEVDDDTRYRAPPVGANDSVTRARYADQIVATYQLGELLEGGEFEVTAANESDEDPRYELVGSASATDGTYGERDIRLVVDDDGVIHELEANGSLADNGTFAFDYRVERLDVDSVEQPPWVAVAPEPLDTRPTAGFENCTSPYLTLGNEDPDAVPAGSVVTVTLNETDYTATLDAPLDTGERRALYLDADGDLAVTDVESVPENRTAMPNGAQIEVETGDGLLLTSGAMGFGCESDTEGSSGSESASGGSDGEESTSE